MSESLYERLKRVTDELGEVSEAFAEAVYCAVENEALKQLAIDAGVDHTQEGTLVLADVGAVLQHERDVNRELRRALTARDHLIERLQRKP